MLSIARLPEIPSESPMPLSRPLCQTHESFLQQALPQRPCAALPFPVLPPAPPNQSARLPALARWKLGRLVRRASLAPSTPLQQQRTLHPSTPTKSFHHEQLRRQLPQISPAQSPSRRPIAPNPSHSAGKPPQILDRAAH